MDLSQHQEVFFDASTPITRKKWKTLSTLESSDSRVIWQHVTEAIRTNNAEAAADAKHQVIDLHVIRTHTMWLLVVMILYQLWCRLKRSKEQKLKKEQKLEQSFNIRYVLITVSFCMFDLYT